MTPEQKARELIGKFTDTIFDSGNTVSKPMIKQCALIAVEEILSINYDIRCDAGERLVTPIKDYYDEVKAEIEKL